MFEVYTDGASTGDPGRAGAGIVIRWDGKIERFSIPLGEMDTHEAEFTAVIKALELCKERGAQTISLRSDSQTVVAAIEKEYIHKPVYKPLLQTILTLADEFPLFFVKWIPSKQNKADQEAKNAIRANR
ncbi:ribonuclease HI family protein [Domibacillus sp. A3M-37]|uniref:ribonuclease HI family protein n=1 Tax=Domibacillus sp. A3M-37 TaxID=2962037 RepID=UPI0020B71318|nr:ribonuclease HI family protein [Domibacillus sp. A3M-37]MCP3763138.1 ribonuclease HI family protein [Domibacillus sp. A3M-37]